MRTLSLKIDVCTHGGLHRGVRPLLRALDRANLRATFCLACGPDTSGRAIFNVLRPGFVRKMVRTGAATRYGWRTLLSGTLLPARPVASGAPEIVADIVADGHEVAIHGWDHRGWQDGLERLMGIEIEEQLAAARGALEDASGAPVAGTAAPGWIVTTDSLLAQERLGFAYASDLRGGPPCRLLRPDGAPGLLQIPTTGPCIEECLAVDRTDPASIRDALLDGTRPHDTAVFAVHAEVEGRDFLSFFETLLPALTDDRDAVLPLEDLATELATRDLPSRVLSRTALPGRAGTVATSATPLNGDSP